MNLPKPTYLVPGASGHLGSAVLGALIEAGMPDTWWPARAAAAALTATPVNATHEICGPHSHTVDDIAALAQDVFSRRIEVIQVDEDELARRLLEQDVPDFYVLLAVMTDANQRAAHFEVSSSVIEVLTGTAPQTLERFFIEHRSIFLH